MSIGDMNLDQATEATIRITDAISSLLEDNEVVDLLNDIGKSESGSPLAWLSKYLSKIIKLALCKHKDSIYEIVSALRQIDKKEVGKLSFKEVVADLKENWEIIIGFFTDSKAEVSENEPKSIAS